MKIHILGICGTFMGSLAVLAKELNFTVTGQDTKVYPPMSTQLQEQGISLTEGYLVQDLPQDADLIVIGNVMRRGQEIVEHILNNNIPYMSGPEFLEQYVLKDKHVLMVSGTHGKTTTTSLLAWILEHAGLQPGFLIGGVANNFPVSARIGGGKYFVIEGDEYDCAFFDKNSKFLHYRAKTIILNNLEFDHADIFNSLEDIVRQFHLLLRKTPGNGLVIYNRDDENIKNVISRGCWSLTESFSIDTAPDNTALPIELIGEHNRLNTAAAICAANHVGVNLTQCLLAVHKFLGVKRRLELKGQVSGVRVFSDFAHHPTAIKTTLNGLRSSVGSSKIHAVIDVCSNTMKLGVHKDKLGEALGAANFAYFYHNGELSWDLESARLSANLPGSSHSDKAELLLAMLQNIKAGDVVLLMSNGAFEDFIESLLIKIVDAVIADA